VKKKRYTVSLCDHIAGEFVPYKQIDIIATDDNNAIQKADEWVASIPELIEEETWLIIKQGLRVNEWVILGLKARQTGGLRRTFALRLGSEFAMNVGWHEH